MADFEQILFGMTAFHGHKLCETVHCKKRTDHCRMNRVESHAVARLFISCGSDKPLFIGADELVVSLRVDQRIR